MTGLQSSEALSRFHTPSCCLQHPLYLLNHLLSFLNQRLLIKYHRSRKQPLSKKSYLFTFQMESNGASFALLQAALINGEKWYNKRNILTTISSKINSSLMKNLSFKQQQQILRTKILSIRFIVPQKSLKKNQSTF